MSLNGRFTLFIDELRGPDNWATWKFHMKHLLKAKGLWGMVTEMDTLVVTSNAHARVEFEKGREEVFSILVLNVSTPRST